MFSFSVSVSISAIHAIFPPPSFADVAYRRAGSSPLLFSFSSFLPLFRSYNFFSSYSPLSFFFNRTILVAVHETTTFAATREDPPLACA